MECATPKRAWLSRARAHHDEAGMGGIEVLPIGLLVLTVVSLIVISAWSVIDAKLATTGAAREATRTAVETFSFASGTAAGREAWKGHDRAETPTIAFAGELTRCGRISATVTAAIHPVNVPFLHSWGTIAVRSVHSELTDPYRNGRTGEASCN